MKQYQQLSFEERVSLSAFLKRGDSISDIAQLLNRHRSTIYRELERNQHSNGYYSPHIAHRFAYQRCQRPSPKQNYPYLRKYVARALHKGWSPEIIAGRMKHSHVPYRVCTETLYKLIYSPFGKQRSWPALLAWARPKRSTWRAANRSRYLNFTPLSERSQPANERREFGHWEGDSVHFTCSKNRLNVTTLIERKTRFSIGVLQTSTRSKPVMTNIKSKLNQQPRSARKSITLDQGTEFSYFQILERPVKGCRHHIKTYYCNPKSPWQKGAVENFNLRLRQFLPRNFNINNLTQESLEKIINNMNRTPRKCLDFKTPQEVYNLECRT